MVEAPTDDRAKLLAHFAGDESDHTERWSKLWDKGNFLPFDRGLPNPALEDTLKDNQEIFSSCFRDDCQGGRRRKRALVPGCGRGYDVLLLASFGYDTYGLEVSETAVKKCIEEQKASGHNYPSREGSEGGGRISFVHGDFFGDDWVKHVEGGEVFDLIYDYTVKRPRVDFSPYFLSALPPSLRPAWALRLSQLLAQPPHGNLICVEFPTYKDPKTGGPPYALPPKVYIEHLSHPGTNVPYSEDGHVKEGALGEPSVEGLERIAHWQPERTHEIGKGTDWVSIWRHKRNVGAVSQN